MEPYSRRVRRFLQRSLKARVSQQGYEPGLWNQLQEQFEQFPKERGNRQAGSMQPVTP